ncbi:hypothetical protein [Geodermatophilus sp. SYSU D00766]
MATLVDVQLKEFEQLRQEIVTRINLAYALIAVELTILGAGLTLFEKLPEVVIGLAVASSFLWLIFIDHAVQVYKLAAYIALWIGPRLRSAVPGSLLWEEFLRRVDGGRAEAAHALFGRDDAPKPTGWVKSGGPSAVLAFLFGGSPPVLVAAYLAAAELSGPPLEQAVRWGALGVTAALWSLALLRYRCFRATVASIKAAILERSDGEGAATPDGAVPSEPSSVSASLGG